MDKAASNKKTKIIFIVILAVIDALLLAMLLSFLIIKSVRGLDKTTDSLYVNRADRFSLSETINIDDCFDKYNRALDHRYSEKALVKCAKALAAERDNNIYVVTGCRTMHCFSEPAPGRREDNGRSRCQYLRGDLESILNNLIPKQVKIL